MSIRPLLSSLVGEKAAPVRPPVSSFRPSKAGPVPWIRGRNLGGGWMQWHSNNPQSSHSVFMPRCAGTSRHERLARKHVPDSDPGQIPARTHDTRNCGSEAPTTRPLRHSCESMPRTPIRCRIPMGRGWDTAKHTLTRPASSLETQELPCTKIVRLGPWSPPAY